MKIGYLGPKGTYCYGAAKSLAGSGDVLMPYMTIPESVMSVMNETDMAIVPIENTYEGSVTETLDALIWDSDLKISGEVLIPVRHMLYIDKRTDISAIKRVATHRHAYLQCKSSIERILGKKIETFFTPSTAAAFSYLNENTAVIAGQFAECSDAKAECSIADSESITRFAIIKKEHFPVKSSKVCLVFEAEHKPGGLLDILSIFKEYGLNMVRIESRPQRKYAGRYIFIVDIEADISDPQVSKALDEISKKTVFYKHLGAY